MAHFCVLLAISTLNTPARFSEETAWRGNKFFELSNHLGNVLVTVSDRKVPANATVGAAVTYYKPVVITASDYYPFGMMMPGRNYNNAGFKDYRYGFNGKENDNDVKGVEGSQQDYGMRIYDPSLGRFLSVDPLTEDYSWNSVYAFAENDVIRSVDLDGCEKYLVINNYDKYGRITKIRVESIVTVANQVVDQDFKIRGKNNDLTKKDIYIQHVRGDQYIARDNSRNGSLTPKELLAYNTSSLGKNYSPNFDRNNGIVHSGENCMGKDFETSNGRIAYTYLKGSQEGVTHNYKEGEKSFENTRPILGSETTTGWVFSGGRYTITNNGVTVTIDGEFGGFDYMMKTQEKSMAARFLRKNGLNVGFIESVTITYTGRDSKAGFLKIKKS